MNVLITGGNFFNTGAEAMTLAVMSEIKRRDRNAKIFILCSTDERCTIRSYIDAEILEYHQRAILITLGGVYGLYAKMKGCLKLFSPRKKHDKKIFAEYHRVMASIDIIIDVSGLVLAHIKGGSSNLDLYYLYIIMLAYKRNIPIILMPQSFGPFEYSFGVKKIWMMWLMRRYLSYPVHVYAREQKGYKFLKEKLLLNNTSKSTDMVLQVQELALDLIFKKPLVIEKYTLPLNSVAIVPHVKQFKTTVLKNKFLELYREIISLLIESRKNVIIICHADADMEVAKLIANMFVENDNVHYIDEKINSISYCGIIAQCQFAIAGRYHSIVHAYKQNVPCITFGWAEKYKELFSIIGQEKYYFSIDEVSLDEGIRAVREMNEQYKKEKNVIGDCLKRIREDNCFAILDDFL